jgi:hypothetical protein
MFYLPVTLVPLDPAVLVAFVMLLLDGTVPGGDVAPGGAAPVGGGTAPGEACGIDPGGGIVPGGGGGG